MNPKSCPSARSVCDLDASVVQGDDLAGNAQPQPEMLFVSTCPIRTVKTLKYAFLIFIRDSRAIVTDSETKTFFLKDRLVFLIGIQHQRIQLAGRHQDASGLVIRICQRQHVAYQPCHPVSLIFNNGKKFFPFFIICIFYRLNL